MSIASRCPMLCRIYYGDSVLQYDDILGFRWSTGPILAEYVTVPPPGWRWASEYTSGFFFVACAMAGGLEHQKQSSFVAGHNFARRNP